MSENNEELKLLKDAIKEVFEHELVEEKKCLKIDLIK